MQKSSAVTGFTGQSAQFQNLREDGLKIRSQTFRNKKQYSRTQKHKNSEY